MKKFEIASPYSPFKGEVVMDNGVVVKTTETLKSYLGYTEGEVLSLVGRNGWNCKSSGEVQMTDIMSVGSAIELAVTGEIAPQTVKISEKVETLSERLVRLENELNEAKAAKEMADAKSDIEPNFKDALQNSARLTKFMNRFISAPDGYDYRIREELSAVEAEQSLPDDVHIVKPETRGTGMCAICNSPAEQRGVNVLVHDGLRVHRHCAKSICVEDPTGHNMAMLAFYKLDLPEGDRLLIERTIARVYHAVTKTMLDKRAAVLMNPRVQVIAPVAPAAPCEEAMPSFMRPDADQEPDLLQVAASAPKAADAYELAATIAVPAQDLSFAPVDETEVEAQLMERIRSLKAIVAAKSLSVAAPAAPMIPSATPVAVKGSLFADAMSSIQARLDKMEQMDNRINAALRRIQ
jgi:hypothetical protein